jgi:hypothetical protein
MKKKLIPSILLLSFLAMAVCGCYAKQAHMSEAQSSIDFFDSASFDRQLSLALRADFPSVTVNFPAVTTLNSIPQRLDHWFSKVEEYDGDVKLIPVSETGKGIVSEILSLLTKVYDYLKDKAIYSPVKDYNAFIYYKESNGIITKVVFERKQPIKNEN